MKFSEKIKILRVNNNMTQNELAKKLGLTLRTIANYEAGISYPKKREVYNKLAEVLNVNINYLLTEDEEFLLKATEKYGSVGERQAMELVNELKALFSDGEIKDEDKDEMMKALQDAYWISKQKNKNKNDK